MVKPTVHDVHHTATLRRTLWDRIIDYLVFVRISPHSGAAHPD